MKNKKVLALLLVGILLLVFPATVGAITDGEPDGDGHPFVGLMVAQDDTGKPMWRCSGTLLSPTVFLTAGHCTYGAAHVEIWFDSDVDSGIPSNGYPFEGNVGGTPYTHPAYTESAFYRHDVGVVVLEGPVNVSMFGSLPAVNSLDKLKTKRGLKDVTFTAVGYGLQKSFPDAASWKDQAYRIRMVSYPKLVQINAKGMTGNFSMLLSNNANTGGTCYGDSGGPNFKGNTDVVAGVTSFGLNGACGGTGGVFRMDRQDVLDFVNGFLN